MRKTLLFVLFCVFISGLYSCQKQFEITDPAQPGTTDAATSYQPNTKGSYWKYKDSVTGFLSSQVATGVTRTINGKSFTAFVDGDAGSTDTVYYGSFNNSYNMYGEVGNTSSSGNFLFNYFNDTVAVGKSWEYVAGQGNGLTAHIKTTIVEKNIRLLINSISYTNVAHTSLELSYDLIGPIMTYDFYIAKGVGIIKVRATVVGAGDEPMSVSELTEYKIK